MHYGPIMIDLEGIQLVSSERKLLQHPRVGGVILFARNYQDLESLKRLVKDIRDTAKKPILIGVDHEGGRIWRFKEGFTKIPAARQYGLVYEHDHAEALKQARNAGLVMAAELLDCNIDFSLAPVLDLDKGVSTVIGDRSFHKDPQVVAKLARAFIDGMNQAGMMATGKHFPGHGGCILDSHFAQPVDSRSLEELMSDDLIPFQALSQELGAIMPAHITYPAVDSVPAGFSRRWLQEILRGQLQFTGAIISDCLSMKGAAIGGDYVVRARVALDAGCDMVILAQQDRESLAWILESLERDTHEESHKRLASLAGKFHDEDRNVSKSVVV